MEKNGLKNITVSILDVIQVVLDSPTVVVMSPAPAAWVKKGSPQMPNLIQTLINVEVHAAGDSILHLSIKGKRWEWHKCGGAMRRGILFFIFQ